MSAAAAAAAPEAEPRTLFMDLSSRGRVHELPSSLVELTLEDAGRFFADGLARVVVRSCPRLESLHLGLGFLHHTLDSDTAAALAELLRAMPGLRALTIGEAWLSPDVLRALAGMPHLASLTLRRVDSAMEGLEALGRGMARLENLVVQESLGDRLALLIRGMAAAPRLASLLVSDDEPSHCTRLAAAFAGFPSDSALTDLALVGGRTMCNAEDLEALLATLAPLRRLRSLSLTGFRPCLRPCSPTEVFVPLFARLAAFPALERLSLGDLLGQSVGADGEDVRLAALIATVASAAPRLGSLRTGRIGCEPLRLAAGAHMQEDEGLAGTLLIVDPLRRAVEAAKRVEASRVRHSGRAAWGVVAAGIVDRQERRVAGAARRPSCGGRTIAETLPASVLREVAACLPGAVPLLVC
jgi:hypothetical protein